MVTDILVVSDPRLVIAKNEEGRENAEPADS